MLTIRAAVRHSANAPLCRGYKSLHHGPFGRLAEVGNLATKPEEGFRVRPRVWGQTPSLGSVPRTADVGSST